MLKFIVPAVIALMAGQSLAAEALSRNTISVGGRDRAYSYYVSSKADRRGYNFIVYALHDDGQTIEEFSEQSGWTKVAEENGFVVVFPEAVDKVWAPNSGAEDDYLKAVYDDAAVHMIFSGAAPMEPAPGARAGGAAQRAPRVWTWFPFQDLTGVGAGARVAQGFAMNWPGLFAAVATLDGKAFGAAYAKGEEPAQGFYQAMRGKNATPKLRQAKKDVPIAMWLFTTGAPNAAATRLADYWKRADRVSSVGTEHRAGPIQAMTFTNAANPQQQVRTSALPPGAKFDGALAATVWSDFFAHVARWTSSPNGDLGSVSTPAEVAAAFESRTLEVGGKTYKYYLKLPSTYRKGQPMPLVLSAHGFGFPAWLYLSQIKMHEVGEREGFITAYLQGQMNGWEFRDPEGGDSKYVQAVIADVIANYGADAGRVYMQGFSLGSGVTYMMAVTHPQLFAAVSPNSGIGPMSKEVETRIAELKAKSDLRVPMMIVYGDADSGASTDGKIPGEGVLRGAIQEMKAFDRIAAPDKLELLMSDYVEPYGVLVPGGRRVSGGVDARYPKGRFEIFAYASDDAKPLNLLDFVWVTDMAHGADPRQAQLEWDFFKQWRRNADGSLSAAGR